MLVINVPYFFQQEKQRVNLPAEESQTAKGVLQHINRLANCSLKLFLTEMVEFKKRPNCCFVLRHHLHRENKHFVARSLWLVVTKGSVANAYFSRY